MKRLTVFLFALHVLMAQAPAPSPQQGGANTSGGGGGAGYGTCNLGATLSGSVTATDTGACSIFTGTLTGNVTSFAYASLTTGKTYQFQLTIGAGGPWTITGASGFNGFPAGLNSSTFPQTAVGIVNYFWGKYDGVQLTVDGAFSSAGNAVAPTGIAPTAAPASGMVCWVDPADIATHCANPSTTFSGGLPTDLLYTAIKGTANPNDGKPVLYTDIHGVQQKSVVALTQNAGATITVAAGKTATVSNTLTFAGTDSTTETFQGTGTVVNRDSTDTLTNKTFDTAGTGNSFKINGTAITAVSGTGAVCLVSGSACSGAGGGAALNPSCTFMTSATGCTIDVSGLAVPNADTSAIITQCWTGASTTQTAVTILTYVYALGGSNISTVAPTFSAAAAAGYCTANLTSGGVNSFNARVGTVTPQSADYTCAQVTNCFSKTSANTMSGGGTQDFSAVLLKNGYQTSDHVQTDFLCNTTSTVGAYACSSNIGTTETLFNTGITIPTAATSNTVDGTHKGLAFDTMFESALASGAITLKLYACSAFSGTGGIANCTGHVELWGTAGGGYVQTLASTRFHCVILGQSTATTFNTSCDSNKGWGPAPAVSAFATSVPNSSTNWVLVWSVTFTTAGPVNTLVAHTADTDMRFVY